MNSTHRLIICNRAPAAPVDGWIHIVPKGELPNAEAGLVQVLDDASLDSILANITEDKNRLGANWPGIYAGREHFIYDSAQDSEALAWFKDFEKRANGIWARDDGLTSVGTDAVKNRLYKYTSFVTDPADLEPLSNVGSTNELPRLRILKIETVGFTNHANGKELLTPITNRFSGTGVLPVSSQETPGTDAHATMTRQHNHQGPKMKSVCTLLGLSADADEIAVHAAVSKLLNRGDISADVLATLKAENKLFGEQNQVLLSEQSETLLDACSVKEERIRNRLTDAMRPLKNRHERLRYLADFGYVPGEHREAPAADRRYNGRVLNRGTGAGATRESFSSSLSTGEGEQIVAIKIQNRASELQGKGLKYDSAWNQARREVLGKM